MADRKRPRASAPAQVGPAARGSGSARLRALLLCLLAGCGGEAHDVQAADATPGLTARGTPPRPPGAASRVEPALRAHVDPKRAATLQRSFQATIARWTAEAGRLSRGKAGPGNVHVSVCVRELEKDGDLVALGAEAPRAPASNLKLVTTASALILLGGGAEWVTPFEALGPLADGTLTGDLVVHASGDPLFDPEGQGVVEPRLRALARELRAAGLQRVQGDLVLDEGRFLTPGPGPSWPDPSQHWAEYCALSGGFSANGGVLHALVRARAVGAPAEIAVHPSPHGLRTSYDVRTVAGTAVDVRVGATRTTATVRGTLGQGIGTYEAEFAHPDPVELFGAVLADALETEGIRLGGGVRRDRGVASGKPLAALRSPLSTCLEAINSESRNGVADQLFLSLGHAVEGEGTRAGAARAVARALGLLGVPASDLNQVDGSGLSRENRVTARAIVALLERVLATEPESARLYRASLAVMGVKGTLEGRLRGTRAEGHVFAKTGWIAGVSALSGYAEPERGPACVFSILVEYPSELGGLNSGCFKKLQDELVLLLFPEGS